MAEIRQGSSSYPALPEMSLQDDMLMIGERVLWPTDDGNQFGTVRWIGLLPDDTSGEITVGVEFDNPIGTGTGKYKDEHLFYAKQNHASLVPLVGLFRACGRLTVGPRRPDSRSYMDVTKGTTATSTMMTTTPVPSAQTWSVAATGTGQRPAGREAEASNQGTPTQAGNSPPHVTPRQRSGGAVSSPCSVGEGRNSQPRAPRANQPVTPNTKQTGQGSSWYPAVPEMSYQDDMLMIGNRVLWPTDGSNQFGTVRWIGPLPDDTSGEITVGIEFDNPIGTGTGKYKDERLFYTRQGHAALVPLMELIRADDSDSEKKEERLQRELQAKQDEIEEEKIIQEKLELIQKLRREMAEMKRKHQEERKEERRLLEEEVRKKEESIRQSEREEWERKERAYVEEIRQLEARLKETVEAAASRNATVHVHVKAVNKMVINN